MPIHYASFSLPAITAERAEAIRHSRRHTAQIAANYLRAG